MAGYSFHVAANNVPNGNTVTISPSAGDLIVVYSTTSSGGGSPTVTFSDNAGGTWVNTNINNAITNSWCNAIGYCLNCPAGITTITCTYNGGTPGNCEIRAVAYSGISSATYIGVTAINTQATPGTGSNLIVSAALNVTSQPALFIGIDHNTNSNGGGSAGTGFTARGTQLNGTYIEDQEVTSTGNATATFTSTRGALDTFATWAIAFYENTSVTPLFGQICL